MTDFNILTRGLIINGWQEKKCDDVPTGLASVLPLDFNLLSYKPGLGNKPGSVQAVLKASTRHPVLLQLCPYGESHRDGVTCSLHRPLVWQ